MIVDRIMGISPARAPPRRRLFLHDYTQLIGSSKDREGPRRAAWPKGSAELTEEPRPMLGRGVGHAPVGRPQGVMRLRQWKCPPDAA